MSRESDNTHFTALFQQRANALDYQPPLVVDGWAGEKTLAALNKLLPAPAKSTAAASTAHAGDLLYQHALKDLGIKEIAGSASHPRIKQAIQTAATWLDADDSKTAWCGCIMGLWCKELGLPTPAEYFRAANWLNIGTPVDLKNARRGDIVVLSRDGGNHVALFSELKDGKLYLLGGNQSNSVNISAYTTASLRGIRRLQVTLTHAI